MNKFGSGILTLFGAIITLAIISVIISKKSRAPEAIQAFASGLANVVGAAVRPQGQQISTMDQIMNKPLSQILKG